MSLPVDLLCCLGVDSIKGQCEKDGWRYDTNNTCDEKIKKYCDENSFDPICSCLNSKENFPACQDLNCQKFGYQTNNMKNTKCPNIVTCNQILKDVEVNDSVNVDVQQLQICGSDPDMEAKIKYYQEVLNSAKSNKLAADSADSADSVDLLKSKIPKIILDKIPKIILDNYLLVFIFILILIIIISISILYFKNKNENENENKNHVELIYTKL